jgi:hypothetical protein
MEQKKTYVYAVTIGCDYIREAPLVFAKDQRWSDGWWKDENWTSFPGVEIFLDVVVATDELSQEQINTLKADYANVVGVAPAAICVDLH